MSNNTEFGFKWSNISVTRICHHREHRILEVKTPRETLQIHVTPTGFIRTFKSKTPKR